MLKRSVLALLVLVALSHTARSAETLSQLISDARVLALDNGPSVRQRFTDAQVTEWLNQAQREESAMTRCLRQALVFQLQPGVTYYALPSNYLTMERVTVGSKYIPEMSPAALDGRSRGWEYASGYPTYFFINFSNRGMVGFAPFPQTSTDTDTVKVEYDVQPNDLVNGTDLAFNGVGEMQDYAHGIVYFAAAMMSAVQGLTAKSSGYMTIYTTVMGGMSKQCLARPVYIPGAVGTP